jgi:hypothetical protein
MCATLSPLCEGGDDLAVGVGDVGHDAAPDREKRLEKRPNTPPTTRSEGVSDVRLPSAGVLTRVGRVSGPILPYRR